MENTKEAMNLHPIQKCRVCQSEKLLPILSLGAVYVSNFIDKVEDSGEKIPLELTLCDPNQDGCGLLQLTYTTPTEYMYNQYWYKSGTNKTMTDALRDITKVAEELVDLKSGDIVLDIGANDGTLLRSYTTKNTIRVGFEPALNLVKSAKEGGNVIIHDFFNAHPFQSRFLEKKAKIITSIAMFYDLDEPNKFVDDIVFLLDKDGVWINQMSYLPSMLEQNAVDNICHEHLEFYSLKSLEFLLRSHNLEIFDVELNDVNGGSFRVYIKHISGKVPHIRAGSGRRVGELIDKEREMKLGETKIYLDFAKRITELKKKTVNFIKTEIAKGKTIFVYGASTKGNTLLQYYKLDNTHIKAAIERNPDKWGKKTVGSLIPIISEEQARKQKPDYFFVLPWHFIKEFTQREAEYLKSGGKFIVPLPEFKIIGASDMTKQEKRPAKFICVDCLDSFPFEDMVCVSESDGLLVSVCKKCGKKREDKHV